MPIDAIRNRLDHPCLGYGVARDALRAQIVTDIKAKYDWTIAPEDIVFLPGVEPGFNMALKAMLEPGDGVLVQTPAYRPMLAAPSHWGMVRIDAPLVATDDGYTLDLVDFGQKLASAKALLFCNPHNPTGKVFTRAELEAIADLCRQNDTLIVSDEIHCELLFDGRRHVPIASLSPDIADRTITLMSAAKTYNTAGLKTAFAIVQNKTMRERYAQSRLGMVADFDDITILGHIPAVLLASTGSGITDLAGFIEHAKAAVLANDSMERGIYRPCCCHRHLGNNRTAYRFPIKTDNLALSF